VEEWLRGWSEAIRVTRRDEDRLCGKAARGIYAEAHTCKKVIYEMVRELKKRNRDCEINFNFKISTNFGFSVT
jgi:hypothetical protein